MNKVIVKINSKQKNDKQNTIKMKALANAYTKNGILYVIYKEKDLNEEKGTGGVQQQQVFVEGKESVSDYITPYGNLKMKVKTHRLEIITGMKSTIKIDYALYINNSWQSDNELMIRLEPAN